jgi:hypothetical protein
MADRVERQVILYCLLCEQPTGPVTVLSYDQEGNPERTDPESLQRRRRELRKHHWSHDTDEWVAALLISRNAHLQALRTLRDGNDLAARRLADARDACAVLEIELDRLADVCVNSTDPRAEQVAVCRERLADALRAVSEKRS